MKVTQGLVDRTQDLLRSFECLLDQDPQLSGELRIKLATAELCLFKIAALMQKEVDSHVLTQTKSKVDNKED